MLLEGEIREKFIKIKKIGQNPRYLQNSTIVATQWRIQRREGKISLRKMEIWKRVFPTKILDLRAENRVENFQGSRNSTNQNDENDALDQLLIVIKYCN